MLNSISGFKFDQSALMETSCKKTLYTVSRRLSESTECRTVVPSEYVTRPLRTHWNAGAPNRAAGCYAHKDCAQTHAKKHGIDTEQDDYEMVKKLLTFEPELQNDEVLVGIAFRVKCPFAKVIPPAKCLMQASYRDLQNYAKAQDPRIRANSRKELMRDELIERRMSLLIRHLIEHDSWKMKHSDHLVKIPDDDQEKISDDMSTSIVECESMVNGLRSLNHLAKREDPFRKSKPVSTFASCRSDDPKLQRSLQSMIPKSHSELPQETMQSRETTPPTSFWGQTQEFHALSAAEDSASNVIRAFPEGWGSENVNSEMQPLGCNPSGLSFISVSGTNAVPEGQTHAAGSRRITKASKQFSDPQDDPTPVGILPEVKLHQTPDSEDYNRTTVHGSARPCKNHPVSYDSEEPDPGRPGSCAQPQSCSARQNGCRLPESSDDKVEAAAVLAELVKLRQLDIEERVMRDLIICVGMLLLMFIGRVTV